MFNLSCHPNNYHEQQNYLTKFDSKCGDYKENKTPWAYRKSKKIKSLKKSPQLHLCEQLNRELCLAASKSCCLIEDVATEWYKKQKESKSLDLEQRKSLSSPCLDLKPNIRDMVGANQMLPLPSAKGVKSATYISPEFQELLRQHDERVRERCVLNGLPREYTRRRRRKKKEKIEEPPPEIEQEVTWKTICSCDKIEFRKVVKKCQAPCDIPEEENLTCCGLCKKKKVKTEEKPKKEEKDDENKVSCCGLCKKNLDKPKSKTEQTKPLEKEDEDRTRFYGLFKKKSDKLEAEPKKPLEKEKASDEVKTRFCGLCTKKPSKTETKTKELPKEKTKPKEPAKEKTPKPLEKEDETVKCCGLCKKKQEENKTDATKTLPQKPATEPVAKPPPPKPLTKPPAPLPLPPPTATKKPEKPLETPAATTTKESKSRLSSCFKCFKTKEKPLEPIQSKEEVKILPPPSEDLRPRYLNFKRRSSQIPIEDEEEPRNSQTDKRNLTPRVRSNKEAKSYDLRDSAGPGVIELVKPQFRRGSRKSKERVKGGAYAIKRVTPIKETIIQRYKGGAATSTEILEKCTCAQPQEIWTKTHGTQTLKEFDTLPEWYSVQRRASLDSAELKTQAQKCKCVRKSLDSGYRRSSLGSYDSLQDRDICKARSSLDSRDIRKTRSSLDSREYKRLDVECECAKTCIDSSSYKEKKIASYNAQEHKNECARSSIDSDQRRSSSCRKSSLDSQECTELAVQCECARSSMDSTQGRSSCRKYFLEPQVCAKAVQQCECAKSCIDSTQQRSSCRKSSLDSQVCTKPALQCECARSSIDSTKQSSSSCKSSSLDTKECTKPILQCECSSIDSKCPRSSLVSRESHPKNCRNSTCSLQTQNTTCSLASQDTLSQCQCKNPQPLSCFQQQKQKPKYLRMQGLVSSYWQHPTPYPLPKSKPKPKKKTLLCECKKSEICENSSSNITLCANNLCRQSRSSGGNCQGLIKSYNGERLVGFGNNSLARKSNSICTQQICKALKSSNQNRCSKVQGNFELCPNTANICDCSKSEAQLCPNVATSICECSKPITTCVSPNNCECSKPISCISPNTCNCSKPSAQLCPAMCKQDIPKACDCSKPNTQLCPHLNQQNICMNSNVSPNMCNCSQNICSTPPSSCIAPNICIPPPSSCNSPNICSPLPPPNICFCPKIETPQYTTEICISPNASPKSCDCPPTDIQRYSTMYNLNEPRSSRLSTKSMAERVSSLYDDIDARPSKSIAERFSQINDEHERRSTRISSLRDVERLSKALKRNTQISNYSPQELRASRMSSVPQVRLTNVALPAPIYNNTKICESYIQMPPNSCQCSANLNGRYSQSYPNINQTFCQAAPQIQRICLCEKDDRLTKSYSTIPQSIRESVRYTTRPRDEYENDELDEFGEPLKRSSYAGESRSSRQSRIERRSLRAERAVSWSPRMHSSVFLEGMPPDISEREENKPGNFNRWSKAFKTQGATRRSRRLSNIRRSKSENVNYNEDDYGEDNRYRSKSLDSRYSTRPVDEYEDEYPRVSLGYEPNRYSYQTEEFKECNCPLPSSNLNGFRECRCEYPLPKPFIEPRDFKECNCGTSNIRQTLNKQSFRECKCAMPNFRPSFIEPSNFKECNCDINNMERFSRKSFKSCECFPEENFRGRKSLDENRRKSFEPKECKCDSNYEEVKECKCDSNSEDESDISEDFGLCECEIYTSRQSRKNSNIKCCCSSESLDQRRDSLTKNVSRRNSKFRGRFSSGSDVIQYRKGCKCKISSYRQPNKNKCKCGSNSKEQRKESRSKQNSSSHKCYSGAKDHRRVPKVFEICKCSTKKSRSSNKNLDHCRPFNYNKCNCISESAEEESEECKCHQSQRNFRDYKGCKCFVSKSRQSSQSPQHCSAKSKENNGCKCNSKCNDSKDEESEECKCHQSKRNYSNLGECKCSLRNSRQSSKSPQRCSTNSKKSNGCKCNSKCHDKSGANQSCKSSISNSRQSNRCTDSSKCKTSNKNECKCSLSSKVRRRTSQSSTNCKCQLPPSCNCKQKEATCDRHSCKKLPHECPLASQRKQHNSKNFNSCETKYIDDSDEDDCKCNAKTKNPIGSCCEYDEDYCSCNVESSDDECKCNSQTQRRTLETSKNCKHQRSTECHCNTNRKSCKPESYEDDDEDCKCKAKTQKKSCQHFKDCERQTSTSKGHSQHCKNYKHQTPILCQCNKERYTLKTKDGCKSYSHCDKERRSCKPKSSDHECKCNSKLKSRNPKDNKTDPKELAKCYYPAETKTAYKIRSQSKTKSCTEFNSSKRNKQKSSEINKCSRSLPNSPISSTTKNYKATDSVNKKQSRSLNCFKGSNDKKRSQESLEPYQRDEKKDQKCCSSSTNSSSSGSSISKDCQESSEISESDSNKEEFCTCNIEGHISEISLKEIVSKRRRRSKGGSSGTEEVKKSHEFKKKPTEIKQKDAEVKGKSYAKPKLYKLSHPKPSNILNCNRILKPKINRSTPNSTLIPKENLVQKPKKSSIKTQHVLQKKPFKTLEFVTKVNRESSKESLKKNVSLRTPLQEIFLNNRQRSKGGSHVANKIKKTQSFGIRQIKTVKKFKEQREMSIPPRCKNSEESSDNFATNSSGHDESSLTSLQENLSKDGLRSKDESALTARNLKSVCILNTDKSSDTNSSGHDHRSITLIQDISSSKHNRSKEVSLADSEIENGPYIEERSPKETNESKDMLPETSSLHTIEVIYSPKYSSRFSETSIRIETPCKSERIENNKEYSSNSDSPNTHSQRSSLVTLHRSKQVSSPSIKTRKSNDFGSSNSSSFLEANNSQISNIVIKKREEALEYSPEESDRNIDLESSYSLSFIKAINSQDSRIINKESHEETAESSFKGIKGKLKKDSEESIESSHNESRRYNDMTSTNSSSSTEAIQSEDSEISQRVSKEITESSSKECIRKNVKGLGVDSHGFKENNPNTQKVSTLKSIKFSKDSLENSEDNSKKEDLSISESEISSSSIQCKTAINRKRYKGGASEKPDTKKSQENVKFLDEKHSDTNPEQTLPTTAEQTASAEPENSEVVIPSHAENKAPVDPPSPTKKRRKCKNISTCCTRRRSDSSDSNTSMSSKKSNPLLLCFKDSLCCTVCHRKKKLPPPPPQLPEEVIIEEPKPPPPRPKKCKLPLRTPGAAKFRALTNVSPQHLHCFKDSHYWLGITANYPQTYQEIAKRQQLERERSAARRAKLWGNKCPKAQPTKEFYEAKKLRDISPAHRKCFDIVDECEEEVKKRRFIRKTPCPCRKHKNNCVGEERAKRANLKTCPCHQRKEVWKSYSLSSFKSKESSQDRKLKTKNSSKSMKREENRRIKKLQEPNKEDPSKNFKSVKSRKDRKRERLLKTESSEQSFRQLKLKAVEGHQRRSRSKTKYKEVEKENEIRNFKDKQEDKSIREIKASKAKEEKYDKKAEICKDETKNKERSFKEIGQNIINSKEKHQDDAKNKENKRKSKEEKVRTKHDKIKEEEGTNKEKTSSNTNVKPSKVNETKLQEKSAKETSKSITNIKENHHQNLKSKEGKLRSKEETINSKSNKIKDEKDVKDTQTSSKNNVWNPKVTKDKDDTKGPKSKESNQSFKRSSNKHRRNEAKTTKSKDEKDNKHPETSSKSKESYQNLKNNELDEQVLKRRKRSTSLNIFKRFSKTQRRKSSKSSLEKITKSKQN